MKQGRHLNKNIVSFLPYIYAPAIVMVILMIVFISKGIFPFGTKTIDYADMGQMNVPMYYHLYDAMHGKKSLFFDWYTGLGINMSETANLGGLLTPFNVFFYFVPRTYILQSLSIFTMIKMMAMAAAMYTFLHKTVSADRFWKVLFGVSYAFSGFALQYYTNSQWLDIAAMFPLLILGINYLFRNKSYALYIIMLTLCLIGNFYCSAMILLFLFFAGGLYILLITPKGQKKHQVWSLGIGTLAACGLSAVVVLPAYKQMAGSARMILPQTGFIDFYKRIVNTINYENSQKWLMLFGTALAAVVIVKGIIATRRDKKTAFFVVGSILIVSLQIGFENINLIWHGGSYVFFPLRFGYMISFVFMSAGCYYAGRIPHLRNRKVDLSGLKGNKILLLVRPSLIFCILSILTIGALKIYAKIPHTGYMNVLSKLYFVAFIIVLYSGILLKRNRIINYRWASIFVVLEMLIGAYVFISPPAKALNSLPEQNSDYVYTTNNLKKELDILPSQLDRIKNIGNTLNSNYPFVLQKAAISNWTHSVSGAVQQNLRNLGYSTVYTRVHDSGGTVFSDALLNIKQTVSACKLDDGLYTLVSENKSYRLYNNKFTLPLGLTMSSKNTLLNQQYSNCFEYQNAFFEQLSGQKELIHTIKSNSEIDDKIITKTPAQSIFNDEVEYTLNIQGNKALYFYSDGQPYNMSFYVQGKIVSIPTIGQEDNTKFSTSFNNNLVCLGTFSNEAVKLKIVCPYGISEDTIHLGLLNLDKLSTFTHSYDGYSTNAQSTNRGLTLTVQGSAEKDMLFLPISYDAGWSCSVNGQKAAVEKVANSFIGIHLQTGENKVKLTFVPSGLMLGGLISVITLLLLVVLFFIKNKRKITVSGKLMAAAEIVFFLAWGLGIMLVYIIPIGNTIFQEVFL